MGEQEWLDSGEGKSWAAEYEAELRRHRRVVWREKAAGGGFYLAGYVCGEEITEGGWYDTGGKLANWMTRLELEAFQKRCWKRSDEPGVRKPRFPTDEPGVRKPRFPNYIVAQCGGCKWFGALNMDWGFCCNQASPLDGRVVFEHGGCGEHSTLKTADEGGA